MVSAATFATRHPEPKRARKLLRNLRLPEQPTPFLTSPLTILNELRVVSCGLRVFPSFELATLNPQLSCWLDEFSYSDAKFFAQDNDDFPSGDEFTRHINLNGFAYSLVKFKDTAGR